MGLVLKNSRPHKAQYAEEERKGLYRNSNGVILRCYAVVIFSAATYGGDVEPLRFTVVDIVVCIIQWPAHRPNATSRRFYAVCEMDIAIVFSPEFTNRTYGTGRREDDSPFSSRFPYCKLQKLFFSGYLT